MEKCLREPKLLIPSPRPILMFLAESSEDGDDGNNSCNNDKKVGVWAANKGIGGDGVSC